MRANTKDGRREWWEGSGVKVRHACVVASGYSPYFLYGYSLCIRMHHSYVRYMR